MVLTKLMNISGDSEYVNLEQIGTVDIAVASGKSYYNVIFSGGTETHIDITDATITSLKSAADT